MTSDVTDVPIPILKIQNATLVDSASSGNTSASLASKALANLQNSTNIGLFTNATSVAVTTTAAILASSTPGVTPMLGLGSQAPIATDSASASGPNRFFCSLPQSMPTFEQLACPITQISAMQDLALGRDTSLNNWLSFVSQIGFINAHALLCVGGIVLAICSLAVTLKSYSRLTASLDWNAFSAFQKGHLIFHVASTLYFLLFLCGFVTYLLNIPRAWVILAALCEFLVYGIQIILCFLTTRILHSETQSARGGSSSAVLIGIALVYFVPSVIYISILAAHIANDFTSFAAVGYAIKYTSVLIWGFRGFLAGAVIFRGNSRTDSERDEERTLRQTSSILSASTLLTAVVWILFAVNVFCPQLHLQRARQIFIFQFTEWSHFVNLTLIVVCLSRSVINERESMIEATVSLQLQLAASQQRRRIATASSPLRREVKFQHPYASTSTITDANSTPMSSNSQIALPRFAYAQANSSEALRQLERKWSLGGLGLTSRPDTSIAKRMSIRGLVGRRSNSRIGVSGEELRSSASSVSSSRRKPRAPGIFSGFSQDSTGTLFDDVEESIGDVRASGKQISAKTQKNETWGWRYLIHLSAFFLSVGVFAGIWADILVGQGPIQGAVIAVLTTFSLVVLLQVGFGVFNNVSVSDTYNPILSRKFSIPLALTLIAVAVAGVISTPYSFIIASWLWPSGLILCLSTTGKITSSDKLNPFLQSIMSSEAIIKLVKARRKTGGAKRGPGEKLMKEVPAEESALAKIVSSPSTEKNMTDSEIPLSSTAALFFQSFCVAIIGQCFMTSIFCGMTLAISVTVCLYAILFSSGIAGNVGKRGRLYVGQVNFWATALVGLAFLAAISCLPMYALPMGKGISVPEAVDVLFTISDSNVNLDLVSSAASFPVQGFYIPKNINTTQMNTNVLGKMVTSVALTKGSLFIEVGPSLQQITDISEVICSSSYSISVVFVADDFQAVKNLQTLGVLSSVIGFKSCIGRQTSFESLSTQSGAPFSIEIASTLMVLLNSWLPDVARKRARKLMADSNLVSNVESFGIDFAAILSGITSLITSDVNKIQKMEGIVGSSNWANAVPAIVVANIPPTNSTMESDWNHVSFGIIWGATCGIPSLLALIAGVTSFVSETIKLKNKRREAEKRRRLEVESLWKQRNPEFSLISPAELKMVEEVAKKVELPIDLEDAVNKDIEKRRKINIRQAGSRVSEYFASIGWFLFALGVGFVGDNDPPLPSPLMYAFGACGFGSCIASFSIVTYATSPSNILVSTLLNVLSLLGAGHTIHVIALESMAFPFSRLAMTGASLYVVAKSTSIGLASGRHSRIALEMENIMLSLSLIIVIGWITAAAGLGRYYLDISSSGAEVRGLGPLGSIICTAIASILIMASSWFNAVPVIAISTALSIVSLTFAGGMVGQTASNCFFSTKSCSTQQIAMFYGSVICVIGLSAAIAVRFWSFESEEIKHQKLLLKYQSSYQEKMRRRKSRVAIDAVPALEEGKKFSKRPVLLPDKAEIFHHISKSPFCWNLWRLTSILALLGWVLFLGGFGASSGYPEEAVLSGILFTILCPVAICGLTLALLRSSRHLAVVSLMVINLSILSFGAILQVSTSVMELPDVNLTPAAIPIVFAGSLLYISAAPALSNALIYRMNHQYKFLSHIQLRYGVQIVSWISILVGMALWLTSGQEDSVSYVGAILATVICALAISIHLIDDNTNVFNPPSVLAYFPNFVTQLSYIALGGVVFKACAFTSNCSESTCKAIVVGPALIIAGAIGFYLTSEIKSSLILMFGGFWRDAVLEDLSSNSDNSEDSDASVSSTHKKKRKPKAYIQRGPLDLYGLVLSWKVLQHGLKCLFFGMIASIGIVAASLGSKRPDKNWDPAYTGSVILVVSGIMSSFLFGAWLTIGTMHIFNTFVPMALLSLSMSGHVTFWGMTYGVVTFEAGMFAGSIVYGTCVLTILLATCGWSNRQKSSYIGDGWTVPMLFQVASLIGWLILVVTFGINTSQSGIVSSPSFVACLICIALCPVSAFFCWFRAIVETVRIRMLLLGSAGLIIMTAGATLHRSALELSQTSSSVLHSSRMGQLFGSVIIIVSQTVFIIHWTQIFTGIELTKEEKAGRLSEPRLRDDAVSWIYAPSSYASLAVLIKLSICGAAICWVIFISLIGMSNPESVYPPIQVHYAFLLSSIYAILGLFYHVFMHWTSFGLLGIISSFVSFSTVGAVMFSLLHSAQPSNGLQTIGIAIALIQTIFLTTTVVLLLHKPYPPVSSDEILTILHTVLVGIICFGWLATIVAIGIRRGGGPPAYTQAVFSGLFTMVGLLVEKTRPGIVIHGFLRALNVFSCILTAAISSASLFSDTESLNSNKIGSIIDFAGSSLLLLGGLFYIMAVFIHSIKPREDLLTQLALQDSKSLFGSNEAVKGSMETLTANKDKKQKEKPDSNESSNDDLAESNSKNSAETVSSQNSPRSLSPDQSDNSTASKPSNGKLKFNKRMKLKEESKSSDSSSSEKNKKASSPKIYSLGSSQETIDSDKTETSARRSSTKSTIMTVLERLKLSSSKKSSSTKASLDSVAAPSTPALKAGSFSLIEQFKKLSPKSSLQSLRSGAFELAPPKSAVTVSAKATHATQEQKSSKGILGSVESVEIIEMTPNA